MTNASDLIKNILDDMRVELTETFDRHFERKGFFGAPWKPRVERKTRGRKPKGSLLLVTGAMRRSIRAAVRGNALRYTSSLPYATVHNEGGRLAQRVRAHARTNRRTGKTSPVRAHDRVIDMPRRQFIGDHPEVQRAVREIINDNLAAFFNELAKQIKP
ncbi:MAG: phage virion morphogenesis protein [Odoribacteraceae bacterium]|nr:phage virion morphogenesis protein [Odoribacteraceae bacterium]